MAILKGVLLTLKAMGLKYTIRKAIRRTLRMPYIYNGVAVKDAATLRVLRGLATRGHVWTNGNEVFFSNEFGVFAVPVEDVNLRSDSLKKLFGHHGSLTINLHMAKDAPLSTVTRSKTALDK